MDNIILTLAKSFCHKKIFYQRGSGILLDLCPSNVTLKARLNRKEFNTLLETAELVITHAGVGNVIKCVRYKSQFIIVPRRSNRNEHIDDHQLEFCDYLSVVGYKILYDDVFDPSIINSFNENVNFNFRDENSQTLRDIVKSLKGLHK
jgi:UDP-N-acetylglucosamine transferase subunit ALG13